MCITLCCATPCVAQLPVLCNSLCCACCCVVHLPALCTLLRCACCYVGNSDMLAGGPPPGPPRKISRLECRCVTPCVVHLPVLCIPCVVHPPVLYISLCCASLCVVQLPVSHKIHFPFFVQSSIFYLRPKVNEPQLRVRFWVANISAGKYLFLDQKNPTTLPPREPREQHPPPPRSDSRSLRGSRGGCQILPQSFVSLPSLEKQS